MIDHLPPSTAAELDGVAGIIDAWVEHEIDSDPLVLDARRDPLERRWWVNVSGEEKSEIAVWFSLRQRTVEVESAFMPGPIDNRDEVFAMLLRRNALQVGVSFDLSAEGGVFLRGHLANGDVSFATLDGALGAVYAYTEASFRPAIRLGFASAFDS